MNTSDRIQALDKLARDTGQPRAALLAKVAGSWQLNARERWELEQELRTTAEPINPAHAQLAKQQLARADAVALADRRLSDLRSWRLYEAADPFSRARMREMDEASIERGRSLDIPDDEPPAAA